MANKKVTPETELAESPAAETMKPQNSSKTDALNKLVALFPDMDIQSLEHLHNSAIALIGKEGRNIPDGAAKKNAGTIKTHYKEDVDALFEGEELSEDFKTKAQTLFEAAVEARVVLEREALNEEFEARLDEEVQAIREDTIATIDAYLDRAVSAWLEENQVAIERSLRTEATEDFIEGLRTLFNEHNISVPEEKIDIVEALENKVAQLEASLDEMIRKSEEIKEETQEVEATKEEVFAEVAEGLVVADAERLKTLSEGVEFENADTYRTKLVTIKEHYLKKSVTPAETGVLEETFEDEEEATKPAAKTTVSDPLIESAMAATSRAVRIQR